MPDRLAPEDREMLAAIAAVWALIDALDRSAQRQVLSHVAGVRREIVDLMAGLPLTTGPDGTVSLPGVYLHLFAADLRSTIAQWVERLSRDVAVALARAAEIVDTGFRGALSTLARAAGVPAPLIVLTPLGEASPVVTAALMFNASALRSVGERIASSVSLAVQQAAFGALTHAEATASVRAALSTTRGGVGGLTSQVTSITRTGVYSIANAAAAHAIHEAGDELPDVQLEWQAIRDRRVDRACLDLDGKRRPAGGSFPGGFIAPPRHTSCRCRLIPYRPTAARIEYPEGRRRAG